MKLFKPGPAICHFLRTCCTYRSKVRRYIKIKCSSYRPGMAHSVGRGIALLFHDPSIRRGWVVSSMPRPHFTPKKYTIPIVQEAGCAPGPVWTGGKSRPHRDSIPDHPVRKIPYIWQCNIRMLARSYMFVSVLLIVEVCLFRTKMPVKSQQHGQVNAVSHYIRCLMLFQSPG